MSISVRLCQLYRRTFDPYLRRRLAAKCERRRRQRLERRCPIHTAQNSFVASGRVGSGRCEVGSTRGCWPVDVEVHALVFNRGELIEPVALQLLLKHRHHRLRATRLLSTPLLVVSDRQYRSLLQRCRDLQRYRGFRVFSEMWPTLDGDVLIGKITYKKSSKVGVRQLFALLLIIC